MGNLTKNFSWSEFACKGNDCCEHSSPISLEHVEKLQALRDYLEAPLIITSGFRCNKHNTNVGGAPGSQHTFGLATDLTCPTLTAIELCQTILDFFVVYPMYSFDGIGLYPDKGFVHLDSRDGKAHWSEVDGIHYTGLEFGLAWEG